MKTFKALAILLGSTLAFPIISVTPCHAGAWNVFLSSPTVLKAPIKIAPINLFETGKDVPLPAPGTNQLPAAAVRFDPSQVSIHVFARCLNEQGEAALCHWQGPPGDSLWGSSYWHRHPCL